MGLGYKQGCVITKESLEREMIKLFAIVALCSTVVLPVRANIHLPKDVRKFIEKREGCDHTRGEIPEPEQKRKMKDVEREIERLCKGTDKALAQLRSKYASRPEVLRSLDEFEPEIEAARVASPEK
jgi:hypothetical protein